MAIEFTPSFVPSRGAEAIDAFGEDWSVGVSFVLPDFHKCIRVMDIVERDNAAAIIIFPMWRQQRWWHRLNAPCWQRRVSRRGELPPSVLVARNPDTCFFGKDFNCPLVVMRVDPIRETH